jgi:small neutral amino acid transporter SnatA (MarC family)
MADWLHWIPLTVRARQRRGVVMSGLLGSKGLGFWVASVEVFSVASGIDIFLSCWY